MWADILEKIIYNTFQNFKLAHVLVETLKKCQTLSTEILLESW